MTKNTPILDTTSSVMRISLLLTSKELSEKTQIELTKIRRYVKDILPPDPEATQQSGKSRRYRLNDAFKVYLAHFLVSKYGFITEDAKAILADIDPWLDKKQLYPEYVFARPDADDGVAMDRVELEDGTILPEVRIPVYYPTTIQIMRANTESKFYYKAIIELDRKTVNKGGRREVITRYAEEQVIPKPKHLICDDLVTYLLPVRALREDFRNKVEIGHFPF